MSERECSRAAPLGLLLFTLKLQPVLERVDAACEEAPLVSYLADMNMVGKLAPASRALQRLCVNSNGLRRIEVEPYTPKCGIYGIDEELAAAEDV